MASDHNGVDLFIRTYELNCCNK